MTINRLRRFPADLVEGFITLFTQMPPKTTGRTRHKGPPPGDTGQEALYLRFLSEKQVPVTVKLRDGEAVYGWIEYFDERMIRLTREGKPNLFIYKNQIRTISESFRHIEARRRERNRSATQLTASVAPPPPSPTLMTLPGAEAPPSPALPDTHFIDAFAANGSQESRGGS
jgi:host factor-I protein